MFETRGRGYRVNSQQTHGGRSNRRHGNPGDLAALKRRIWRALCDAEDILDLEDLAPEIRLKAISTMGTVGAIYAKLLEGAELESQVKELEALIQSLLASRNGHGDVTATS
jgi:hypothetical protein